jgi:hypothetical protein
MQLSNGAFLNINTVEVVPLLMGDLDGTRTYEIGLTSGEIVRLRTEDMKKLIKLISAHLLMVASDE